MTRSAILMAIGVLSSQAWAGEPEPAAIRSAEPAAGFTPLNSRERFARYARNAWGPAMWLRSGTAAAFGQLNDEPPEWKQGAAGYGRRFASAAGRRVLAETIEYGAGALTGEDPRYSRCRCSGFFARAGHALASRIVARDRRGNRRFAFARVAGVYGAAMIATAAWYPARYSVAGDGLRLGSFTMASGAGVNLVREFLPELRRLLRRR